MPRAVLFVDMDEATRSTVYANMFQMSCGPGKSAVIIKQGDTQADYFYVIDSGKCDVLVDGKRVTTLNRGQSFGELVSPTLNSGRERSFGSGRELSVGPQALMYFAPRAATVVAVEPTVLWTMDRMTFRSVLLSQGNQKRENYKSFLEAVPLCNKLTEYERNKVAEALEEVEFEAGATIIRQGDSADAM